MEKKNSDVNCFIVNNKTKIKICSKYYSIRYNTTTNFELDNLACAICCCLATGLTIRQIIKSISKITKPDGRMQLVNMLHNQAKIFVDYAHTPEALKNILIGKNVIYKKPNLNIWMWGR